MSEEIGVVRHTSVAFAVESEVSHKPRIVSFCFYFFLVSPWKDWQISYLKGLQAADLRRRRDRFGETNEMFLAYQVEMVPSTSKLPKSKPILLNLDNVYNVNTLLKQQSMQRKRKERQSKGEEGRNLMEDETCYVRGKLLGFVEITQRPYGIATPDKQETQQTAPPKAISVSAGGTSNQCPAVDPRPSRPVLTNLAVRKSARKYGIGSKLLEACEYHVRKRWKLHEIVLEVEDYNPKALKFYMKRGYNVLFSDPASRRYDVHGLWLRKVRCRREVMRKVFYGGPMDAVGLMEGSSNLMNLDLFRRMRENFR